MIEELLIRSLGVIDEAVVEFSPGLTVVTGETGAGKTMVVTGLGLLLGSRADAGAVRHGAPRAEVEGRFVVPPGSPAVECVESSGGALDEDAVIVRRSVASQGRSRSFVGGAGVPLTVLSRLGPMLVTVHGQADQHGLLSPARQRQLLDAYAAVENELSDYRRTYESLLADQQRLRELADQRQERIREADLLRFGVDEIERVGPTAGEDLDLQLEEGRLAHAEELVGAAAHARAAIDDDAESDVVALLARVRRSLDGVRDHDPILAGLADRAAELGYLANELASELSTYVESVAADPARLTVIGDRRAALAALTRKYGGTVDEVLAWSAAASDRLLTLDATDDDLARLADEVNQAQEVLAESALTLSTRRHEAASTLSKRVTNELADLAMPDAELVVSVTSRETADGLGLPDGRVVAYRSDGIDEIAFLLRPHSGVSPQPIGKGASGGELSRIMLALEVVLAGADDTATMVFDEVDAGVGGRAAVEVGLRLAQLARHVQVIVVTHLPQVAAFADRHLVVTKSRAGAVTRSDVASLDDAGRAQELARMLAGLEDSELGRAHAGELLDLAARAKAAAGTGHEAD